MPRFRIIGIAIVVCLLSISSVWARTATGKVVDVTGNKVTVKVDGGRANLIKKDTIIKADGGMARVIAVNGDNVTISIKKSMAEKLNRGGSMNLEFSVEGENLQGC